MFETPYTSLDNWSQFVLSIKIFGAGFNNESKFTNFFSTIHSFVQKYLGICVTSFMNDFPSLNQKVTFPTDCNW